MFFKENNLKITIIICFYPTLSKGKGSKLRDKKRCIYVYVTNWGFSIKFTFNYLTLVYVLWFTKRLIFFE